MKTFLEQYGVGLFILILISILIAFASPIGRMIKTATNKQVKNVDTISTREVQHATTDVSDYVYASLYNDGNLVLSSHEIQDKENIMIDYGYTNMHPWTGTIDTPNMAVKTVTFKDIIKMRNCSSLFSFCQNLEYIYNIENLDTSECIDMQSMFYYCKNLKELNVNYFDTSNVTNMRCMFVNCNRLISLDLHSWNTSHVSRMDFMFDCCSNLQVLDISNFNTTKVPLMTDMFLNCYKLKKLDLSNFDTRNCVDMSRMFCQCFDLQEIIVSSKWNTTNADTKDMFTDCGIDHVTYIGGNAS